MKKSLLYKISEFILPYKVMVIITFLLILFWNLINKFAINYIVPIFSTIPDNNIGIAITIAFIPIAIALFKLPSLLEERCHPITRYIVELYIIILYGILKYSIYDFYFVISNLFDYALGAIITTISIEVALLYYREKRKKREKSISSINEYPFYIDTPTTDNAFDRSKFVNILLNKVQATLKLEPQNALTILLSEEFGYGKTSFFLQIEQEIKQKYQEEMILINFKPWLYDNPDTIIKELFNVLSDKLEKYAPHINKTLTSYVNTILQEHSSNALVSITKPFIISPISLEKEHDEIMNAIRKIKKPIIILIDDVDRLQKEELLAVLKLVRNTADFPHIFYIIAADKNCIEQTLSEAGIKSPYNFLKKIINYELLFPANDNVLMQIIKQQLNQILNRYIGDESKAKEILQTILSLPELSNAFHNPRDLYRFLNSYTFSLDAIATNKIAKEINYADLFAIILIQYLRPDVYKILRDYDDVLLENGGQDNRYILKKYYKSVFEDKQMMKRLAEIEKKRDPLKQNKIDKPLVHSIQEAIADGQKDEEKIIISLLRHLFGDSHNFKEKNKICHRDAYFRYFSFKLKNSQMTTSEVILILQKNGDEFEKEIIKLINEDKEKSFIHKLIYISINYQSRKTELISKLFTFVQQECRFKKDKLSIIPNSSNAKLEERYFTGYRLSTVFYNLYRNEENHFPNRETEIKAIEKLINEDKRINMLALFLGKFSNYRYENSVFTEEDGKRFNKILVDRFISEHIKNNSNPFTENNLDTINNLRSVHWWIWSEYFAQYLNNIPDYMDWFARSIYQKNDGRLYWNKTYNEQIGFDSHGNLNDFIDSLDKINKDEKLIDLKKLLHSSNIDQEDIKEHPFLQYVQEQIITKLFSNQ